MFLAESLNQKLKSTLEKYELNRTNNILFPYTKPRQNPKVLEIQRNFPELTREQLEEMTQEEFLNKFSLQKIHKKWQRKFVYNFPSSTKKFSDECISPNAKISKTYIKDLLDRDIFEAKIPRWNNSTKPSESKNDKVPLKKTLFEVNHGFNNYLVVPLKEKFVEEGTQSRDIHIFGDDWNVSNKLEKNEKKLMDNDLFIKSMNNTQKYWRTKNYLRMNEMEMPISSERRQVEEPRYYKHYQSPRSLTVYNYEKMKKAKNDLWLEREKVFKEEKMRNMGSAPEKINCIVEKRMGPQYQERFEVLTGKKQEIKKEKKRTQWKDGEVYYVSAASTTSASLTQITSIPAEQPVLLKGDANSYNFTVISTADELTGNLLKVSNGVKGVNDYVLANGGKGVGFYKWVGDALEKGMVYLPVDATSSSAPAFINFQFDNATGIEEVRGQKEGLRGEYYNLSGQRLDQPTKGLYIVNGKKVILK